LWTYLPSGKRYGRTWLNDVKYNFSFANINRFAIYPSQFLQTGNAKFILDISQNLPFELQVEGKYYLRERKER